MRTYRQIIALWPSFADLADDVRVDTEAVRLWSKRDRIPTKHWDAVAVAADLRGFNVTIQELAMILAAQAAA